MVHGTSYSCRLSTCLRLCVTLLFTLSTPTINTKGKKRGGDRSVGAFMAVLVLCMVHGKMIILSTLNVMWKDLLLYACVVYRNISNKLAFNDKCVCSVWHLFHNYLVHCIQYALYVLMVSQLPNLVLIFIYIYVLFLCFAGGETKDIICFGGFSSWVLEATILNLGH